MSQWAANSQSIIIYTPILPSFLLMQFLHIWGQPDGYIVDLEAGTFMQVIMKMKQNLVDLLCII